MAKEIFTDAEEIVPAYLHITDDGRKVGFKFCILKMDHEGDMPILTSITAKDEHSKYSIELPRNNK